MGGESAAHAFRLGTFSAAGSAPFAGIEVAGRALGLRAAAGFLRAHRLELKGAESMLGVLEHWEENFPVLQRIADAMHRGSDAALSAQAVAVGSLLSHPPVDRPRNIYCSGANYKKHVVDIIVAQAMTETLNMTADERRAWGTRKMDDRIANGTPYFFCKPQSTVTGPHDPVVLPADVKTVDWELELGVFIGRRARRVSREHALDHVAGYTVVNDITSRERVNRRDGDMREMGMDWVLSKGSPTFLPIGPYLVPAAYVGDPQQLLITLRLNGEVMQNERTDDMIFGVARLIEHLSSACELLPGDLICTGSPAGNGVHYKRFLRHGDVLEGEIAGLGAQRNPCIDENSSAAPR
jgi:2,4-didehydro-3-deoxy-L-rhamnonate hydrolase